MELIVERAGAVATLTLNRPERLNAVSLTLYDALAQQLKSLDRDSEVRALILTGAGRAFCVGADLKAHSQDELTAGERRTYVRAAQRVHRRMQKMAKPIVGAVNGHAIGAGLELALSCDLVVIAEAAKLRFPEVALGTFVGGGTVVTLPRRVGLTRAKELLLLAEFFTPWDALNWGIANRVVAAPDVLRVAHDLARQVARRAPVSVGFAKRLLNRGSQMKRDRALRQEAAALLTCMATDDWKEGVRAFHEKREPDYRGE
jgi:enoyl-CoA hydratase